VERRLAAVLAVDVVGYSRKISEAETATLTSLRECREKLRSGLNAISGRIINTAGDSVLAEVPSTVEAVLCAHQFQEWVRDRNVGRSLAEQIEFRAGVHQGELVEENGDVFGDSINIAVRLEGIASPSGVAISDRVHDDVAGKFDLDWTDGGEIQLKNIPKPVRTWFHGGIPKRANDPSQASRPSVAVLPFLCSTEDETMCDGITEDVIVGLARFTSLFVSSRSSSFTFRDSKESSSAIARKLGVSFLVEGSLRKSSDRIRISVRLVEAASDSTIWAERYDRAIVDLFELQDEIVSTLVGTLAGRIESSRTEMSLRKPPTSLLAYDVHLQGLARFRAYDASSNADAVVLFRSAISLDPHYAHPHSFLALALLALEGYGGASPETRSVAIELARKALEISPQDATCQRILGHVLLYDRQYDLAEYHSMRAVQLNPNDSDCLMSLGYLLVQRGSAEKALAFMEQAVRLNPFHPPWYHAQIAGAYYTLGRYERCLSETRKMPHQGGWSFRAAASLGKLGRSAEAAVEAAKVRAANKDFSVSGFMRSTILLEREEDREDLRQGLLLAGLPE